MSVIFLPFNLYSICFCLSNYLYVRFLQQFTFFSFNYLLFLTKIRSESNSINEILIPRF